VSCPDPETLARYAEASLDGAAAETVRTHLDGCASCREVLVTLVRSSHPSPGLSHDVPWDVPVPGTSLGRYRVTGIRGAGGMGVVLAAYDPQLDRQVALKLLRPDGEQGDGDRGKQRLVREAQLMARVRHPNVVTVHDVVVDERRVVIAMELVQGQTLREWLEAVPRSATDRLEAFRSAGKGLLAAHEAGVVHRDFKPDNVLIGPKGDVLVSDFGLAWSHALPKAVVDPSGKPTTQPHATSTVGTPAYMAPEQLAGEAIDARADQFSFCVALYEAFCGARPYEGNTVGELLASMRAERLRPMPRSVPAEVARVLMRGLSLQPGARFPSMRELLAALEPKRRLGVPLLGAAALIVLATGGVLWNREARCRPTRQRVEALWPTERQRALIDRLGAKAGEAQARRLSDGLARVAGDLREAWSEVCAGTSDDEARARTCLESRITQAELVAKVVSLPDTEARACMTLTSRLDDAAGCRAGELLTLLPQPIDPSTRQVIADARLAAMSADAARLSGRSEDALAKAAQGVELAKRSGWRPVEAEALLAQAQVLRGRGKFKEAEGVLTEAVLAGEAGRHFEALARIAVQHILVLGTQTMRPADAEPWVKRAEAALEQLPRPRLRAEVDTAIAMLATAQLDFERGLATADRALAWAERFDPMSAADLHSMRSLLLLQDGQHLAALDEARIAADRRTALLGPSHPLTLHARLTLGEIQAKAGLAIDGERTLTAALDEVRKRNDLNPTNAASGLAALGIAMEARGQPAEALVAMTQARELIASLGAQHRYSALAERGVGERLRAMGRLDEAIETLERSVELATKAVGANHPETLEARAALALTLAYGARPGAREAALAVRDAARAAPKRASNAQVLSTLALAFAPGSTREERADAIATARTVRGAIHPDVVRALLVAAREGDAEAGAEAKALFAKLQIVDAALAPLVLPSP